LILRALALAARVVLAHADADVAAAAMGDGVTGTVSEDADVVAVEAAPTLAGDDKTTFPACTAESGVTLGRALGVV
jgi:hypothetical protein